MKENTEDNGNKNCKKRILASELNRLQKITGNNKKFDLTWSPQSDSDIEGKVEGNAITIHSENIEDAIDTLQHEFVDYIISQAIKPYVNLVNSLISIITRDAYETKEETVESMLRLMNNSSSHN